MQNFFITHTESRERELKKGGVSFETFKIGRNNGFLLDGSGLSKALVALKVEKDYDEDSEYSGIKIVHLRSKQRARIRAASNQPCVPEPVKPAIVTVNKWGKFSNTEQQEHVLKVVKQFAPRLGVKEVVIYDNDNLFDPIAVKNNPDTFWINAWSSSRGSSEDGKSYKKLWGHETNTRDGWRVWAASGSGEIIRDGEGAPVAELIGNDLYILYPVTSKNFLHVEEILTKILEEVLILRGTPEERAERLRARNEALRVEARDNPVQIKHWESYGRLKDEFITVAKDFVSAFGEKPIHIYNYSHDMKVHSPSSDGRIHIAIWSSDNLESDGKMKSQLFGAPLKCRDSEIVLRSREQSGTIVTDEEDNQVGRILGDTIYIHYPLTREYVNLMWDGKGPEALFRRILEEVAFIKNASPKEKEERLRAAVQRRRVLTRQRYVTVCHGRVKKQLDDSRLIIENHPKKVVEHQQAIVKLVRESQDAFQRIKFAEAAAQAAESRYAKEFDKLFEVPQIVDVKIDGDVIKVFTKTLYCTDPRSKKLHEIGAFRIEIGIGGSIRWYNLTRRVSGFKHNMQAPHVFEDGKACLGNLEEVMAQLIADYEFATLAMLAIQFIETVNVDDDAGKYISQWPIAEIKEQAA